VRDITDGGKYGYLCEVDNIDCFVEKLRQIMTNEEEASKTGASLSKYVRKAFDWPTICAELQKIFLKKLTREEAGR
jgi:glycosyltransferase involved in cell wall biosynthesis